MMGPLLFRLFPNPNAGTPGAVVLPQAGFRRARAAITGWPGYAPTPLRDLPDIAREAGVASVRLKDESARFGLGSFKALGGGYAVQTVLSDELARRGIAVIASASELESGRYRTATEQITVTCASEGNHGRAVAWAAGRFGCRCVVFLHERVSYQRAEAIARFGAQLRRVAGTYDDAVRAAEHAARVHGWLVVSDTAWPGYIEIPRAVMQGYRVMADEAVDQWPGEPPTHVFIQAGVGGAAAAVSAHLRSRLKPAPALVVCEPEHAACLLASAELGARTTVAGALDTIMAGLACGEPSLLAWQELARATCAFMAIPDEAASAAVRLLAERGIYIGEAGAAGIAAMLLAASDLAARESLSLGRESRVLLFATEGTAGIENARGAVPSA